MGDPNSREVPWHQDSQYWPLTPMKEATLWIALDDVTEENGAMDMFTFSAVPESRGQDLPKIQLAEEVSTEFFIKVCMHSFKTLLRISLTLHKSVISRWTLPPWL